MWPFRRNQSRYPTLWAAIDGAIRDAAHSHPDIQIPDKRRASIIKRAVGQVLALQGAGAGQPAETAAGHDSPAATGARLRRATGLAQLGEPAPNLTEGEG